MFSISTYAHLTNFNSWCGCVQEFCWSWR